ncbi:MAG: hypothetical protein ACPGGA_02175 [Balneolaceae bacterium]
MDLGLVMSYIVAGILMIIILTIGYNVNYSGNELSLQESQKIKVTEVIETLNYDFPKIGYNNDALPDTLIRLADSTSIEFYSNIDNSADGSVELISWELTSTSVSNTENPNDYYLVRTVDGTSTTMSAGIVNFTINYYDELGSSSSLTLPIDASTDKSLIDSIVQIEIVLNSESTIGLQYSSAHTKSYLPSSWTKRFSPSNLNIN